MVQQGLQTYDHQCEKNLKQEEADYQPDGPGDGPYDERLADGPWRARRRLHIPACARAFGESSCVFKTFRIQAAIQRNSWVGIMFLSEKENE